MADATSKRAALFITTLAVFLSPYMIYSVNIATPSIGSEFKMDAVSLTWIPTSYLLASAVFLVPLGKIADINGRKRVFVLGVTIFTISSFLLAFSNSAAMMILLRILQGIGGGTIYGTSLAILTSVFPAGERGNALGINTAMVYIGSTCGPFIGGFLTQNFGWRSIFLVAVPIGLALIALTFWKLKGEWAEARGESFDLRGSVLYGLALVAVMYGITMLPGTLGALLALVGTSGIVGFIWWENRVTHPVLHIGLFRRNRVFLLSNAAALIHYCATYAVVFLLSIYLQQLKGLNPADAGLILLVQPAMQAISSPMAGKLSDRIEPRIIASIGMALTFVGLSLLVFLSEATALEFILVVLIILGIGFGTFSSPNTNAAMCSLERRFYGVGSATISTMRLVGQMLSMGITALVFGLFIGRVQITPENHPLFLSSVQISFTIFAALCFVGIYASLARGNVRKCETDLPPS